MNIIKISKEDDLKNVFRDYLENSAINHAGLKYEKWLWKYMENPFFIEKPAMWICAINGKTAGFLGGIPVRLKVGTEIINAAWAVDFMTSQEYRRKGMGRLLTSEANKYFDVFLSIGQTDMACKLFTKMGWENLGYIRHYIKIWDVRVLIKERIKIVFIVNLICLPINALLKLLTHFKDPKKSKKIEIRMIDNFDTESSAFWEAIKGSYKIAVPRDMTYLNWKYNRQPDMGYVKFCAERDHKICGYIIGRVINTETNNGTEGLITDVIVQPGDKDAMESLMFSMLKYIKDKGCSMARCYINNKDIERNILNYGFIRSRSTMRFLMNKNINELSEMSGLNNWHITAGDCDIDR